MKIKAFQRWLIGFFGLAVLINLSVIIFAAPKELQRIYHYRTQDTIWREVAFQEGERAANFVRFLRTHLANTSEIVYPTLAEDTSRIIFSTPALQFYLLPRTVRNCLTRECVQQAVRKYPILYLSDFQRNSFLNGDAKAIAFDDHWGVILPNTSFWSTNTVDFNTTPITLLWELAGFLLAILGVTFFGSQLFSFFLNDSGLENIAIGYGFGLAGFSMLVTILSICLGSITKTTLISVYILFICLSGFLFLIRRKTIKSLHTKFSLTSVNPWLLSYILLTILAAILAVGKGYAATDEIQIWGLKGYGIAQTGQVQSITQWGTNTSAYPLNIPVLIASVKLILGDHLPSAKLLFSLYYLCMLLFWDASLNQMGVSQSWRGIVTLLIGSTPLVFRHASVAYANLPFTFYLFSGGMLFLDGIQGLTSPGSTLPENHSIKSYLNRMESGVLLLLAGAWTRPEGILLTFIIVCLGLAILWRKRNVLPAKTYFLISIPIIVYATFWWSLGIRVYPNPMKDEEILQIALNAMSQGELHISQGIYLLAQWFLRLWRMDIWGFSGIVLLGLVGFWFFARKRHAVVFNPYLLSGLLISLTIIGIYFMLSFDSKHDVSWWVNTGFDRMELPGVLFLLYGLIRSIFPPNENQRPSA